MSRGGWAVGRLITTTQLGGWMGRVVGPHDVIPTAVCDINEQLPASVAARSPNSRVHVLTYSLGSRKEEREDVNLADLHQGTIDVRASGDGGWRRRCTELAGAQTTVLD